MVNQEDLAGTNWDWMPFLSPPLSFLVFKLMAPSMSVKHFFHLLTADPIHLVVLHKMSKIVLKFLGTVV